MPKQKQLTFQQGIQGKFIPRNNRPSMSVYPVGANDNRFNAKMAELLASSSMMEDESNKLTKTTLLDENNFRETVQSTNCPQVHSNSLHRKIVNMLDSLKSSEEKSNLMKSSSISTSHKSQPITFGQLRQANQSAAESKTQSKIHLETNSSRKENDFIPKFLSLNSVDQTNRSRSTEQRTDHDLLSFSYLTTNSPLLDQTLLDLERSNELLAQHYLANKSNVTEESRTSPKIQSQSQSVFNLDPNRISSSKYLIRQYSKTSRKSTSFFSDEQNRVRPPPPSYQSSLVNSQQLNRTVENNTNLQKAIDQNSSLNSLASHLPFTSSISTKTEPSSRQKQKERSKSNNRIRVSPFRCQSPSSIDHQSDCLSSSNEQINSIEFRSNETTTISELPKSFQRDFSRLFYEKDLNKRRRTKLARKAFSDPVRKSIEEAQKSNEQRSRRITTYSSSRGANQQHDEETDSTDAQTDVKQFLSVSHRRPPRAINSQYKAFDPTRKNFIATQSVLKRRIPRFLRVYSKASSSHDVLLQWDLFDLPELESFSTMMTRLYKNENLGRVQLYEIYRTALVNLLQSKQS